MNRCIKTVLKTLPVLLPAVCLLALPVHGQNKRGTGKLISKPKTAALRKNLKPLVITFEPNGGTFTTIPVIKLKANRRAVIRYTINGGTPTSNSTPFTKPISFTREGRNVLRCVAEDMDGTISLVDSQVYLIDTKPPVVSFSPLGGKFNKKVRLYAEANEPCRFYYGFDGQGMNARSKWFSDSLIIDKTCRIEIVAQDRAGHRSRPVKMEFEIDARAPSVTVDPPGGLFKNPVMVSVTSSKPSTIFYSLNEFAPLSGYKKYSGPVKVPAGNIRFCCYAEDHVKNKSKVVKTNFVIDTIPPRSIIKSKREGARELIKLQTSEKAKIYYTTDGSNPTQKSNHYKTPFAIPAKGNAELKWIAVDQAGNISPVREKTFVFDRIAIKITATPKGGVYNEPLNVKLHSNRVLTIYYGLNDTSVSRRSAVYNEGIDVSRNGKTVVYFRGLDAFGVWSPLFKEEYILDTKAPIISANVEGTEDGRGFYVRLRANERDASIYYEIGGKKPTEKSPVFQNTLQLKVGEELRYFGKDRAGNKSRVSVLEELKTPPVKLDPPAGIFNEGLKIKVNVGGSANLYYRLYPVTAESLGSYQKYTAPVSIYDEGAFTLDYYTKTSSGFRSAVKLERYIIDLTPPTVQIFTRKGKTDSSVVVNFTGDENISIYYTLDGTDPSTSTNPLVIGNKFYTNRDYVEAQRKEGRRLRFFCEDIANNRTQTMEIGLGTPSVIPSIPPGSYTSLQTVSLTTIDESRIYYTTDGKKPDLTSAIYVKPLSVTRTTTLKYFAVDKTGFTSKVDSAVFEIDLPPVPDYRVQERPYFSNDTIRFDAGISVDEETPLSELQFRWDWNQDGKYDTDFAKRPVEFHGFSEPGMKRITLEVKDKGGRTERISKNLLIRIRCPKEMVSMAIGENGSFCIDRYEWPNIRGEKPVTNVTRVKAALHCYDVKKRLCRKEEWVAACMGMDSLYFPYGMTYRKDACNTESGKTAVSGKFTDCRNSIGIMDMTGNVWEWVDYQENHSYFLAGGGSASGNMSRCDLTFPARVSHEDNKVGFRCCK